MSSGLQPFDSKGLKSSTPLGKGSASCFKVTRRNHPQSGLVPGIQGLVGGQPSLMTS